MLKLWKKGSACGALVLGLGVDVVTSAQQYKQNTAIIFPVQIGIHQSMRKNRFDCFEGDIFVHLLWFLCWLGMNWICLCE